MAALETGNTDGTCDWKAVCPIQPALCQGPFPPQGGREKSGPPAALLSCPAMHHVAASQSQPHFQGTLCQSGLKLPKQARKQGQRASLTNRTQPRYMYTGATLQCQLTSASPTTPRSSSASSAPPPPPSASSSSATAGTAGTAGALTPAPSPLCPAAWKVVTVQAMATMGSPAGTGTLKRNKGGAKAAPKYGWQIAAL